MSKRTAFTTVTPLPLNINRSVVIDFLRNHDNMISLNPLIKEWHQVPPPAHAQADERNLIWYSITDSVSYLPGVAGAVSYTSAFLDLPTGIQTHSYAPANVGTHSRLPDLYRLVSLHCSEN
jgi:hypothetical protein